MKLLSSLLFSGPIIGTHDSASWFLNIDSKVYNINSIVSDAIYIAERYGLPSLKHVVFNWSQTQTLNISQQILADSHYLDLRLIQVDDTWYTCHGLLGSKFEYIVNDIISSGGSPLLELTTYTLPNQQLCDILAKLTMCPIYMMNGYCAGTYDVKLIYNTFANTPNVYKMVEYNKNVIERWEQRKSNSNQILKLSWTLTPNLETMIKGLLYKYPNTLLNLAEIANREWDSFGVWMKDRNYTFSKRCIIIFDNFLFPT